MTAPRDGRKVKRQRHQLGPSQRSFLRMVSERSDGEWSWPLVGGMIWRSRSQDFRVARSLVKRGLLAESGSGHNPIFTITDAGKRASKIESPQP